MSFTDRKPSRREEVEDLLDRGRAEISKAMEILGGVDVTQMRALADIDMAQARIALAWAALREARL